MKHRDIGSSLVEAVVGITLLGFVLVGVVDTTAATSRVTASLRNKVSANSVVIEIRHALLSIPYSPCPHLDASYSQELAALAHDRSLASVDIVAYEFWHHTSSQWMDFGDYSPIDCASHGDLAQDHSVQRLTLSIVDSEGATHSSVELKARDEDV